MRFNCVANSLASLSRPCREARQTAVSVCKCAVTSSKSERNTAVLWASDCSCLEECCSALQIGPVQALGGMVRIPRLDRGTLGHHLNRLGEDDTTGMPTGNGGRNTNKLFAKFCCKITRGDLWSLDASSLALHLRIWQAGKFVRSCHRQRLRNRLCCTHGINLH